MPTDGNDRRMEDKAKLVFFGLMITVMMPMMGYLWGQIQAQREELSEYKLLVSEKYVTHVEFDRGIEQLVKLLGELKVDLRSHEEEAMRRAMSNKTNR